MPKFTHKGWFGICPVYLSNLESGAPLVHERHWSLLPLFIFSEWFFAAAFFVKSAIDPNYEPNWPIKVTGELEP